MLLHSLILGVAALTLTASARPVSQREGSDGLMKREVPQEHSHEQFLTYLPFSTLSLTSLMSCFPHFWCVIRADVLQNHGCLFESWQSVWDWGCCLWTFGKHCCRTRCRKSHQLGLFTTTNCRQYIILLSFSHPSDACLAAFTNAKAAGNVTGMTAALIYRKPISPPN